MSFSLLPRRFGNVFLRVYLGVFGALVGTLLLSILLVKFANQVRMEAYQEQLLSGLFVTLTEAFAQTSEDHKHEWLHEINQTLGIRVEFSSPNELQLNRRETSRLNENRLVLRTPPSNESPKQLQVVFPVPNSDRLLVSNLWRVTEQQASASTYLLLRDLQRTPAALYEQRLLQLSKRFSFPLELLTHLPADIDPLQQRRLERGEQVVLFSEDGHSMMGYAQLDEFHWLSLGPVEVFNPYPLPLLIGIFFVSLLMLAASIWWFLYGLENRLRHLERASSQLAAGNLQARADMPGKDFVSKLATTFNRMADQVQRLLRTQQEMIHAVSHELRTPVARIRFGLQMIEDLSEDGSPHAAVLHQIQGIDRDIDELDTLIDEILTYARLGQEKLQLQFLNQDVTGLLEEVISGFQRTHPQLELKLIIHNPAGLSPEADLEGRYFQRAIQNLVGNAVRYASHRIHVTCQLENDAFRVDVEDDGSGIPKEDWQRVFMPFSRLDDSRTRSSGGYGLGLSIVQRIIYWHRGSTQVDRSPELQGARFSLIFPRQQLGKLPPLDIPPQ